MKIKAIIVEDEPLSRLSLVNILTKFCADKIELICECDNVKDSVRMIKEKHPDLVFLDIKLGDADNGAFDILKAVPLKNFHVIFTTGEKNVEKVLAAHKEQSTISYLLKPLSVDEVISSVDKVQGKMAQEDISAMRKQIEYLMKVIETIYHSPLDQKVEIPIRYAVEFVPMREIIMIRSSGNRSFVFCKGRDAIESTRNLKHYALTLPKEDFFATSNQYLVNLHLVDKYSAVEGKMVLLEEDCQAMLSDKKQKGFFQALRAIQKPNSFQDV